MSTLSEHTGNGNPPATSLHVEDIKEQIDDLLQHFDVLPSRFDRILFKYTYVFLIGNFFLQELTGSVLSNLPSTIYFASEH